MTATEPPTHPLVDAMVGAHEVIAPKLAADRFAHVANVLETFERDLAPLVAPFVDQMIAHPDVPEHVKALLAPLQGPTHFSDSILIGFALGALIAPVLQTGFAPYLQVLANNTWGANPTSPITPSAAIEGALKNPPNPGVDWVGEAAMGGTNATRFAALSAAAGSGISIDQALLLLRMKVITPTDLEAIARFNGVNPTYANMFSLFEYLPIGVGQIIEANIKGHLDDGTAAKYLGWNGIDPALQPMIKASAGRPFSIHEMWTAIHRGYPGPKTPEDALRQSDINDEYAGVVPYMEHSYPSMIQITRALKAGTMTPARAAVILGYEGYEATDIDAVIKGAVSTATTTHKELSLSLVTRMYQAKLIPQADAITRIEALKYDAGTAQLLVEYADLARHETLLNATIRSVGTRYVAHRLDMTTAHNLLTTAGVDAAAIKDLFVLWDLERSANVRIPSDGQVVGAYRRGIITAADCKRRLLESGIQEGDLAIIVADGYPPTHPAAAKAAADAVVAA